MWDINREAWKIFNSPTNALEVAVSSDGDVYVLTTADMYKHALYKLNKSTNAFNKIVDLTDAAWYNDL